MQQWEYTIPLYSNLELMGLDGWELCGIMEGKHVFKRPIGPNWKERCEAAEAVIQVSVPDDRIKTAKQAETYKRWIEFKNSGQ